MMSMGGATKECSTSKAGAMPKSSACPVRGNRRYTPPQNALVRSWKTSWSIRTAASSIWTTTQSPRTHAHRTPLTSFPTTCRAGKVVIRRTSSFSPQMRSAYYRRSASSPPIRQCITSCRGIRPRWRELSAVSPSRRPRSARASALRSSRYLPGSMPSCWASGWRNTRPNVGWSTRAGPAGHLAKVSGYRSATLALCCGQH